MKGDIKMTETTRARLEGARVAIGKAEKKIERIEIALNGGKNPYYYGEGDLRRAQCELKEATERLHKWESKAAAEEKQESEPRIEAVEIFLENWKRRALEYYTSEMKQLKEYLKSLNEKESVLKDEFLATGLPTWGKVYSDKLKELEIDSSSRSKYLKKNFSSLTLDLRSYGNEWNVRLETIIEREKNAKRQMLISRVKKVVGEIKDATGLYIAANLEINGIVVGTNATARVTTIGAGGWNIQCFHFRVLVKAI